MSKGGREALGTITRMRCRCDENRMKKHAMGYNDEKGKVYHVKVYM